MLLRGETNFFVHSLRHLFDTCALSQLPFVQLRLYATSVSGLLLSLTLSKTKNTFKMSLDVMSWLKTLVDLRIADFESGLSKKLAL